MKVYADNAATTRMSRAAVRAMEYALRYTFGNPSSSHEWGRRANEAIESARATIAKCINAKPEEIYFTSGGTESNNWALKIAAYNNRKRIILQQTVNTFTSSIEHSSVDSVAESYKGCSYLNHLPVNEAGIVNPRDVDMQLLLSDTPTMLVSIMTANNEVGTIQQISDISKICRKNNAPIHTDAVQAIGHVPVDVKDLGVDMLSASAHKFHGPKGVGFLYVRKGVPMVPLHYGGGQERGMRSGTENVPAIIGMAVALEEAVSNMGANIARVTAMRDRLIDGLLQIQGARLNGHRTQRLPGNVNISFSDIDAESLVLLLDSKGIAVSAGSACSTGDIAPSHVLMAMDRTAEEARSAVRITIDHYNTDAEIDYILKTVPVCVGYLRGMRKR